MAMGAGGRPTKLNQVIRHREDGTPVTAAEQVVERIQLGLDMQNAADSAGISRTTIHTWRLTAARYRAAEANGKRLTRTQRDYVEFLNACERAESDAELNRLAIIQRAATGGARVTKVTEKKDAAGLVTETITVTETLRPEWTAAAWWLERRRHQKYARRVEVTGAEGAPLVPPAEAARGLADSLREFMAGAAAASEATSGAPADVGQPGA